MTIEELETGLRSLRSPAELMDALHRSGTYEWAKSEIADELENAGTLIDPDDCDCEDAMPDSFDAAALASRIAEGDITGALEHLHNAFPLQVLAPRHELARHARYGTPAHRLEKPTCT